MVAVITKWTHERVARVAELIDRGLTYNEIGERMGERISGTAKAGGEGVRRLPARHAGLYYKPRQCRGVFMRRRLGWITASCWAIAWTL